MIGSARRATLRMRLRRDWVWLFRIGAAGLVAFGLVAMML